MTVLVEHSRKEYTASAGQTVFPYDFKIFFDADLLVYVNEALQNLNTDYSVSGAGDDTGGNVTFVSGLTVDDSVVIQRDAKLLQSTDFVDGEKFPANTVEDRLDLAIMGAQESREAITRTVRVSIASKYNAPVMPDPDPASVLGWNASNELVNYSEGIDGVDVLAALGSQAAGKGASLVKHNQISIFRPEEYGTVDPTGTIDSTTAFAACLSAINTANGGILYLQPGTFKLSSWTEKTMAAPFIIQGQGRESTKLLGTGTANFIKLGTNCSSILIQNVDMYLWDDVVNLNGIPASTTLSELIIKESNFYAHRALSWDTPNTDAKVDTLRFKDCRYYHYVSGATTVDYPIDLEGKIQRAIVEGNLFELYGNRAVSIGDGSSAVTNWESITVRDNDFFGGDDYNTPTGNLMAPVWVEGANIDVSNNRADGITAASSGVDALFAYTRGNHIVVNGNTVDDISSVSGVTSLVGINGSAETVKILNNNSVGTTFNRLVRWDTSTTETIDHLHVTGNIGFSDRWLYCGSGTSTNEINDFLWIDNSISVASGGTEWQELFYCAGTTVKLRRSKIVAVFPPSAISSPLVVDDTLWINNTAVRFLSGYMSVSLSARISAGASAFNVLSFHTAPDSCVVLKLRGITHIVGGSLRNGYVEESLWETEAGSTTEKADSMVLSNEDDTGPDVYITHNATTKLSIRATQDVTDSWYLYARLEVDFMADEIPTI